jgi:hypothetical protein
VSGGPVYETTRVVTWRIGMRTEKWESLDAWEHEFSIERQFWFETTT